MTEGDCDVSVVVPTHNRPAQLRDCLCSLANQRYPRNRFEVVVVDDGSAESVTPVVSELAAELDVRAISRDRGGPAAARNTGAEHSRGTYLAFTDDDCIADPDWVGSLATVLSTASSPIMVGGRVVNGLPHSPYSTASQLIVDIVYDHYNPDPEQARFFASNNIALPTAAFRELDGFDPGFQTSEDRDLCDRWLSGGHSLMYVPEARVTHAHHLTLASYIRQHFGYGRGAFRHHKGYAARHRGGSSIETAFYLSLVRRFRPRLDGPVARKSALVTLLVAWQAANTMGFVVECVATRGGHRRRDGDVA